MGAFSCDSRLAGGGQLLKHCGSCSSSGVAQPSDRVCAKHCAAGLAIMVSLMSYRLAPAAGGTAGAAAPSVQLAPFGYIPVGTPLTKPGALKRWTQPKWLGLPSHPYGFR